MLAAENNIACVVVYHVVVRAPEEDSGLTVGDYGENQLP